MNQPKQLTTEERSRAAHLIIQTVAEAHGFTPAGLLQRGRPSRIAVPRQVAMMLIRDLTGLSLQAVGDIFRKNHGTVIHAKKRVEERAIEDQAFGRVVVALRAQCRHLLHEGGLA